MQKIEFIFIFEGATKNMYIFKQPETDEKPKMYPYKIYLNKSLFKKQPGRIVAGIVPE